MHNITESIIKILSKQKKRGVERWLRDQEHFLFLQSTGTGFNPHNHGTQTSVTPDPGDPMPFPSLHRHHLLTDGACTHFQVKHLYK